VAENVLNTNVSAVQWTAGSSTHAPGQDAQGDSKARKSKTSRSQPKADPIAEITAEGAESAHELDSFA